MTHELDRLLARGAISGYTCEPPDAYLAGERPTLTYSMYASGRASRCNIARFAGTMRALGGELRYLPQVGYVCIAGGGVRQSRQVKIVVEFPDDECLETAIAVVQACFLAGGGRTPAPGSWLYPDVRVTGTGRRPVGTFEALAHHIGAATGRLVVLARAAAPPLPGMVTVPVLLLECWQWVLPAA